MANELHFFVFFSYMQVTNSYSCPEIKDATTSAACNAILIRTGLECLKFLHIVTLT